MSRRGRVVYQSQPDYRRQKRHVRYEPGRNKLKRHKDQKWETY